MSAKGRRMNHDDTKDTTVGKGQQRDEDSSCDFKVIVLIALLIILGF
jgi:hypothetical protein